nr:hypothetical protein [Tanacetum cinerariifolium]
MQTQTSNTLHNAIMEAGGKDRPPMLAPRNYVQWKSRIKRYIDIKPNHELIHYCLKNPPYKYTWAGKVVPVSEGSYETTTETYMENYKNVSQDIRDQLDAEAEAVQIILIGIDNDIYSIVDACPDACEMWKAIERLKQGESINVQDHETNLYWEFGKFTSRDGELLKSYYSRLYKMMNELVRNQCDSQELKIVSYHKLYDILKQHQNEVNELRAERLARKAIVNSPLPIYDQEPSMVVEDDEIANQDNSPRINRGIGYDNQRIGNVVGARETVEQADWKDDTDNESEDQELEAHYMYMAQIQEVNTDAAADSGPIFDTEPLQKVQNNDHYNVFGIESEHPEQSKSVNDTYPIEQDEHNVIIDSLDMSYDREQIDQNDDDDDLDNERELLASLIEKLKCKIHDSKNRNKFLETSNKVLVDKLKGEIEDFKNKNKSLESSNNRFKEANNKLSETNELMYRDLKKFQAKLDRRNDVKINADLEKFHVCLKEEMVADLRYFNSLELEVDSLISQLETQKTQFLNEIDRLSKEHYYVDHMNAILGVIPTTSVSRPQLKSNPMEDKVMLNNSQAKKQEVEDHRRNVKFSKNKMSVTGCNDSLDAKTSNVNFVCATYGKCVLNEKHDMCVLKSRNGVNSRTKMPMVVPVSSREPKRIVKLLVAKPLRRTVASESTNQKHRNTTRKLYECVSVPMCQILHCLQILLQLVEIILFIVDSGCSKHMTGNLKLLINFVEKFLGTVKFRNNQIVPILGYGDLVHGAVTIKRVYYVEGLNHNLFSIGQFCDADLEVAFRKSTCYICDLKGNDLLTGSRGTDLYSITLQDTSYPNPICLMAKVTSSQAWLWHRCLSHLNFDTINLLLNNDTVIGLPKLKFVKDHLCSSCELGKAKRTSFHTKTSPSSKRRLQLLHMDLCGPMRVESINGKKYVLVIVDDYSRYTWTHFLRSKDETPKVLIDFLRLVQRGLHAQPVRKLGIARVYGGGGRLNKLKELFGSGRSRAEVVG